MIGCYFIVCDVCCLVQITISFLNLSNNSSIDEPAWLRFSEALSVLPEHGFSCKLSREWRKDE